MTAPRSLLAAVLLLAGAGTLAAQTSGPPPFTCSASARTVPARAEGAAELAADVVVTCTGGVPNISDSTIARYDIQLTFNGNMTSKILGAGGASEAFLLFDEPQPGAQFPCDQPSGICPFIGNGTGTGYYGGGPQSFFNPNNRNVYQGLVNADTANTVGSPQTITWPSIPVDQPGVGNNRIYRFTNLRFDAATVKGSLQVSSIAFWNANGVAGFSPSNLPLVLAIPQPSLTAAVRDAANSIATPFGAAVPVNPNGGSLARYATLRFASTQFGADRTRTVAAYAGQDASPAPAAQNTPGAAYPSESGFFNPAFGTYGPGGNLGTGGLADIGTRYVAVFSNIPAGFSLFVDLYNSTSTSGPTARLVSTDAFGSGPFSAPFGNGQLAQVPVNGGTAVAVWEVLRGGGGLDQFDFGVYMGYAAGTTGLPAPATVQLRYGPIPGSTAVPQFSTITTAQPLFTFVPPPGVIVSPTLLTYTATAGGRNPATQTLDVVSTLNTIPVPFNLGGSGGLPLQFQFTSTSTPATVTVGINIAGLAAGTYRDTITVTPANGSGRVTIPVTLTLNAGPQITSLAPPSVLAGGPGFTLTVNGANFTPGTVARWNGTPLATTFVNAGQLTASVSAALIASPGVASITALTLDGALSNAVTLTIGTFTITSISPSSVTAGGPGFDMTVTGTGFPAGATVNVGGTNLSPSSLTATQMVVSVPAGLIAQAGTLPVTAIGPTGLQSNSVNLTVVALFRLDTLSVTTVTATGPGFPLSLNGVGFAAGATVQVGGSTLQPSAASATQITVAIPASLIAGPATLSVTVTNPGPVVSNALSLTVTAAPALTGLNPSSATAGSAALTLTITGTNLPPSVVAQWNQQPLSTTFVSSTQVTAGVPASLLATAGTASITVVTTDNFRSNALTFTINPAPVITALSPASANLGGPAFTLTVTGTNLPSGGVVKWNGQSLSSTTGSPTSMTAQVPANLIASKGSASVNVTTTDGVNSNSLPFAINLPPLTGASVTAPGAAPSGQDQTVTVTLGTYPVDLTGTVTLTFTGDGGLPNDPAIQFQNQTRVFTFTIPAGTQPNPPQLIVKTGTTAGIITLTSTFSAGGVDVTPQTFAPQRIQVGRSAPSISSFTCTRDAAGITAIIDGYSNTREATTAIFDFQAAAGATLGTSQLTATVTPLFSGYFGGSASSGLGGVFRYTQPFSIQGSSTSIAAITVKLGNSAGTSAAVSCQLP